ncbi:MAG: NmrA family NAD(P)-binding protein [Mycobacterium sp.]|nr:NmrA family NAD(P)-binding protein [Mycobacterium sp.]
MILVTSAGGSAGRALVRELRSRQLNSRAFVKNDEQARAARSDGATDVFIGDIQSARDIDAAMVGVRILFHATPTSIVRELSMADALVAACRANGVKHIVYFSVIHPEIKEMFHHQEKLRVEGVFQQSGIPTTFLRASHFMQNYLDFWEFLLAGTLPYPSAPERVMGVVDAEDVSLVAANVLTAPDDHLDRIYDLSTQELNRHEMARIWSTVLGHRVTAVRLPPAALQNPLRATGAAVVIMRHSLASTGLSALPHILEGFKQSSNARGVRNWSQESRDCYERMMMYYDANGLPAGDMTVLPALLGRQPTSYEEFARREAARRGIR